MDSFSSKIKSILFITLPSLTGIFGLVLLYIEIFRSSAGLFGVSAYSCVKDLFFIRSRFTTFYIDPYFCSYHNFVFWGGLTSLILFALIIFFFEKIKTNKISRKSIGYTILVSFCVAIITIILLELNR